MKTIENLARVNQRTAETDESAQPAVEEVLINSIKVEPDLDFLSYQDVESNDSDEHVTQYSPKTELAPDQGDFEEQEAAKAAENVSQAMDEDSTASEDQPKYEGNVLKWKEFAVTLEFLESASIPEVSDGQNNQFQCPDCEKMYNDLVTLKYHFARVHRSKFICCFCYKIFDLESDYKTHLEIERDAKRELIKARLIKGMKKVRESITEAKLDSTVQKPIYEPPPEQFCSICDKMVGWYRDHLYWIHANQLDTNKYECKECQAIVTRGYFPNHFKQQHSVFQEPKKCPNCDESFIKEGDFFNHVQKHQYASKSRTNNFMCDLCGRSYDRRRSLEIHMINKHTDQKRCSHCNKAFDKSVYRQHVREENAKRHLGAFMCDICGFKANYKHHLAQHIARVHDREDCECNECGRTFKSQANLKDHYLNVHRAKKESCQLCGKVFRCKSHLDFHLKRAHAMDKLIKCPQCDKEMYSHQLSNHKIVKHATVKEFACPFCSMEFLFKSELQRHLHSHSGSRKLQQQNFIYQSLTIEFYIYFRTVRVLDLQPRLLQPGYNCETYSEES